jgi:catechol 2,3-dioxygenase-like lactoylglutathione lyase family enzyme
MIPNLTIGDLMIDCANPERCRDFYADLMGCEKTSSPYGPTLKTENGLTLLFAQPDIPHEPPVWPEEPGKQQKQMHLDIGGVRLSSAIRLGATKAAKQYGGTHVTMLDPDGHPFCLGKRPKRRIRKKSEFDLYYEKQGWGAIPDLSVMVDCPKTEPIREFYAQLTGWDQGFHPAVLIPENRMIICFMEADFDYIPPVWPEEPGKQQKQMHFNFEVDDLPSAVEEAIRLGAAKAANQYGGGQFVTMIDPDGHPFCLCRR